MRYKGYNIWYNELQNGWMVQTGYDILAVCATLGSAKTWITKSINKGLID